MRAYYFASLLCATNYVHASLDSYIYYFAGNNGNSSAARKCSTSSVYECPAPSMCAIDNVTKKQYCCAPGSSDAICWAASTKCEGSSSDQPSSTQSGCTNLGVSYCCLKDQERCTGNAKQFRICWSNLENPIATLNASRINETYNDLHSANPSASAYAVAARDLKLATLTTPAASSGSSPTSTPSSPATTSTAPPSGNSGVTGGAIAGIVIGVLGGLVLLVAMVWLLWRRRRQSAIPPVDNIPELDAESKDIAHMKADGQLMELERNEKPVELEAPPVELEAREYAGVDAVREGTR